MRFPGIRSHRAPQGEPGGEDGLVCNAELPWTSMTWAGVGWVVVVCLLVDDPELPVRLVKNRWLGFSDSVALRWAP